MNMMDKKRIAVRTIVFKYQFAMYPRRGLPVTGFLLDAIEIAATGR
jgi:hypothetical protein